MEEEIKYQVSDHGREEVGVLTPEEVSKIDANVVRLLMDAMARVTTVIDETPAGNVIIRPDGMSVTEISSLTQLEQTLPISSPDQPTEEN